MSGMLTAASDDGLLDAEKLQQKVKAHFVGCFKQIEIHSQDTPYFAPPRACYST